MKYLFVDKWADYSIIKDSYRGDSINPIFLLYVTALQQLNKSIYYLDASDKQFSKDQLFHILNNEELEKIILYANSDNISSILRLDLKNKYRKEVDIILLSINEDLSSLIKDKLITNIIFDEKKSIYHNLNIFLRSCNLEVDSNILKNIQINYTFINNIQEKTALVNIGSGCKNSCTFCSISDSKLQYRNIEIIMKEINSLLETGIKYFHVANHNLTCDRAFLNEFCTCLIELGDQYDFAWSCFIVPSFFVNNLDLLPTLVKAKLKKIEIGCESGSDELLSKLGINYTQLDIEKIINSVIIAKIPIIATHFVIGTPSETLESLNETKDFILRILYLTSSLCDIYLHCYFPEKNPYNSVFDNIVKKRMDFVCGTSTLDINDLIMYRKDLQKEIKLKKSESWTKVPVKVLYEQFEMEKKYGITSQMQRDFISKSYRQLLFTNKFVYAHACFSWEIENSIEEYSPVFFTGSFMPDEKIKDDLSNLRIVMANYIRRGYTVAELIARINKETCDKVCKDVILSILREWENNSSLYYVKYLK